LRAVGLRVDGLEVDVLDEHPTFRPFRLRCEIHTLAGTPTSRKPAQRPKVRERIGIDVGRLGEYVVRRWGHDRVLLELSDATP
jgi:hypothetical protein